MGCGTSVQHAGRNEERIEAHAQDDGFPAQEDPSKTATGARSPAAREEGSAACTKEREDLNQRMARIAVSDWRASGQQPRNATGGCTAGNSLWTCHAVPAMGLR